MVQSGYVFIVGSYRSGTSMLRNILNCSNEVAICGETHYLGSPRTISNLLKYVCNQREMVVSHNKTNWWREFPNPGSRQAFAIIGDISTDHGARQVVDHIYQERPFFWRWLAEHVDYEEFLNKLLESDRSDRALFDLLMTFYANGKPIKGEKTPGHVHFVPTLMEWFPNAKIIHIFRDLRAVFVSQQKKKSKAKHVSSSHRLFRHSALTYELYMGFSVALSWLRIAQLHNQYQALYPNNYHFCRFEDLVSDPETHLKELCAFLEIEFTPKMLSLSYQNSSFVPHHQAQGIDTSSVYRWRQYLHPLTNKWLVWWGKKYLREFDYQI